MKDIKEVLSKWRYRPIHMERKTWYHKNICSSNIDFYIQYNFNKNPTCFFMCLTNFEMILKGKGKNYDPRIVRIFPKEEELSRLGFPLINSKTYARHWNSIMLVLASTNWPMIQNKEPSIKLIYLWKLDIFEITGKGGSLGMEEFWMPGWLSWLSPGHDPGVAGSSPTSGLPPPTSISQINKWNV